MKKKFILALVFASAISATGFLSSCNNEKKQSTEKNATKTVAKTTPAEKTGTDSTTAVNVSDSAATSLTNKNTAGNSQKFGHINSADLIKLMPETKKADASLEAYIKGLEKQLGGMQNEYRKKITEYQSQEKNMIDAIKETKVKAIQDLEQQMQQTQAEGQQKIAQKREALYKPILDKAEKAVKQVGKENNYNYIFDTNSGAFIYSSDSDDVMPLVKAKLGLK